MAEYILRLGPSASGAPTTHADSSPWGDSVRNAVVCLALTLPPVEVTTLVPNQAIVRSQCYGASDRASTPVWPGAARPVIPATVPTAIAESLNAIESGHVDAHGNRITAIIERPGDDDFVIYAEDLNCEAVEWLYSLQDER